MPGSAWTLQAAEPGPGKDQRPPVSVSPFRAPGVRNSRRVKPLQTAQPCESLLSHWAPLGQFSPAGDFQGMVSGWAAGAGWGGGCPERDSCPLAVCL